MHHTVGPRDRQTDGRRDTANVGNNSLHLRHSKPPIEHFCLYMLLWPGRPIKQKAQLSLADRHADVSCFAVRSFPLVNNCDLLVISPSLLIYVDVTDFYEHNVHTVLMYTDVFHVRPDSILSKFCKFFRSTGRMLTNWSNKYATGQVGSGRVRKISISFISNLI